MATSYNIVMKEYNGTDYDTLYPEVISSQVMLDKDLRYNMNLPDGASLNDAITRNNVRLFTAIGGNMLSSLHLGAGIAYTDIMFADVFNDSSQIASSSNVIITKGKISLPVAGLQSGVVSSTGGASGSAYNASNIQRQITTLQDWMKLFDFRPGAFGKFTRIVLQTASTSTTSVPAHVKLGIWNTDTNTQVIETTVGTITRGSGADNPVGWDISMDVDANANYDMKVWIEDMPSSTLVFQTLRFTATPSLPTSGNIVMKQITMPGGSVNGILLIHGNDKQPAPQVSYDGGSYITLTNPTSGADLYPDNISCTLWKWVFTIPTTASKIQLKIGISGTGAEFYDFGLIFS
nr:MAG TPA: hypothetical protein [Bacteriophage sp.]